VFGGVANPGPAVKIGLKFELDQADLLRDDSVMRKREDEVDAGVLASRK
jgi:hypothetical protein